MTFKEVLEKMISLDASDIFIRANSPLKARIYSDVREVGDITFSLEDLNDFVEEIGPVRLREDLQQRKSCEFTLWYKEHWRFRLSVFYQRNNLAMVVRKIDLRIPNFSELSLPVPVLEKFCSERKGMILLTGITGSGKSTTIASMLEYLNETFGRHILSIEEPIEFTFTDKKSIINQREIGKDVNSYEEALRQFALHSPDVIYIGTIRDMNTCYAALTAAETGVLVFSTLHTINATSTVERIINFFPPYQHSFILAQLSVLLKGVICLRLLPRIDKEGLVPAYEIMTLSPSISRLLRENKLWEVPKYISQGGIYGMKSFDQSLLELIEEKKISSAIALEYADRKEELELSLKNKGLL
jgi:twitching motility protein PilT